MADTLWAIVPALDLVDLTLQTCRDLLAQSIPVRVLLIDQGSSAGSNDQFRLFAEQHHPRVLLWSCTVPLPSLSAAWNRGLAMVWALGGFEALVVNSDVRLHPQTAQYLQRVCLREDVMFVSALGVDDAGFALRDPAYVYTDYDFWDAHSDREDAGYLLSKGGPDFSCFLVTQPGHAKYPFDEGFIPAFGEDCDAHRRYMLGGDGARIFSVNLPFHHIGGGSRTINQSEEARQRFERQAGIGRAHYIRKWGAGPNAEVFVEPFGGYPVQRVEGVTNPELQARVQAGIPVLETGLELTGAAAGAALMSAGATLHTAAPDDDDIPILGAPMADPKKHSFEALDSERIIDDRWTESKLIAAGYEYKGDGKCKTCGDPVSFYKREKAGDYKGPAKWQIVDEGNMAIHRCKGR